MYTNFIVFIASLSMTCVARGDAVEDADQARECCFPQQFNGRVSFSDDELHPDSLGETLLSDLKFGVDFPNKRLYGEHFSRTPKQLFHFVFEANLQEDVEQLVIKELNTRRCWRLATGIRDANRCGLDASSYRGKAVVQSSGTPQEGLVYALKHHPQEEFSSEGFHAFFITVTRDSCLPVTQTDSVNPDKRAVFHDMEEGLGSFTAQDSDIECDDMEHSDLKSFLNDENFQSESNLNSGSRVSIQKRSIKSFISTQATSIRSLIKTNLINRILQILFPPQRPITCCPPAELEATFRKTDTYYYTQDGYIGQAVTTIPVLYVNRTAGGQIAGNLIQTALNVPTTNVSFLAKFNNNINGSLQLWLVNWAVSPNKCSYLQITDIKGPIAFGCSNAAHYNRTVKIGLSPRNSLTLNVWDVNITRSLFNFTGQKYTTLNPKQCVTLMENYYWKTKGEMAGGNIVLSNIKSPITNTAAFTLPSICVDAQPISKTSSQIQAMIKLILQYWQYS